MEKSRLNILFEKYFNKTATPEEELEFFAMLLKENPDGDFDVLLKKTYDKYQPQSDFFTNEEARRVLHQIKKQTGIRQNKSYSLLWRYAAAVVLLLGAALFMRYYLDGKESLAQVEEKVVVKKDVAPGNEKAIITLADGTAVNLSKLAEGKFTDHGNTFLKEKSGQVNYTANGAEDGEVTFHTMTIPKGGQYQLILADGTKVWLNSASSLHYPTKFTGNRREVSIAGEAYFEVAHNPEKPFIVKSQGQTIKVLGTHFNVKAYRDEQAIKTTLLEGSIELSADNGSHPKAVRMVPGEEATLKVKGDQAEVKLTRLSNAAIRIAWTQGYFAFERADLENVLRELSRWYDVDFKTNTNSAKTYTGKIDRNLTLSQLMKGLQLSGIPIQIEDEEHIIVLPN